MTANLLSRRGAQLATLPLKTVPERGYEIDLPIGSIARGEYVYRDRSLARRRPGEDPGLVTG